MKAEVKPDALVCARILSDQRLPSNNKAAMTLICWPLKNFKTFLLKPFFDSRPLRQGSYPTYHAKTALRPLHKVHATWPCRAWLELSKTVKIFEFWPFLLRTHTQKRVHLYVSLFGGLFSSDLDGPYTNAIVLMRAFQNCMAWPSQTIMSPSRGGFIPEKIVLPPKRFSIWLDPHRTVPTSSPPLKVLPVVFWGLAPS